MIVLDKISKQYQVGKFKVQALNNVSLQFRKHEFVSIIGPSGCGKTTLLNIVGGLDKATTGKIFIDGTDVSLYKNRDWDAYRNQRVGFVFQNYYLLPHLNVYENVEIALSLISLPKKKRQHLVNEALIAVGLTDEAKNMPNQLSGGQMQRVAIARAIVNEPDIILADEPTGALDSHTATQIMDILKSISQKRLVVLVTHNIALADTYATRIIELLDGQVQKDSNPVILENKQDQTMRAYPKMRFFDTLRLSFKNMLRTKTRTLLSMFAGSIGIIGIGLVLSISKGVNSYIEEVQKSALGNYPITIMSQAKTIDEEDEEIIEREEFPEGELVSIREGEQRYDYYNVMDEAFLDYMEDLPKTHYTVIDYNTSITMNIISKTLMGYRKISQSQFSEMSKDDDFVLAQYDVLKGSIPNAADEVALIIDKYNCLDALTLYYLGIDYEGLENLTFDQLLSKQFKVVFNNDLYVKQGDIYTTKSSSYYETLYNDSQFSLKVTAIMREKKQANTVLYGSGLLYTPQLTDVIYENATQSAVYLDQLAYGLSKNVFTGQPYEDEVSFSSTVSKEYQLKQTYLNIGSLINTNRIYVYTPTFADRLAISSFVENYEDEASQVKISYYDYMNNVTTEFASLVKVFSTVLIIFSSVSLIVSAIMIGIITYVSIFERIKDIGILRSVGARKWDIATLFNFETLTIGLFSGLLGILGVLVLVNPVNEFVKKMVQDYTVSFSGISQVIVAKFEPKYILLMVFGSMLLSLIAGVIPAVIASGKNPIVALKEER
ncbi:MAG: ATP-binding cassette domain-containing protein [Bacilli bacterium]